LTSQNPKLQAPNHKQISNPNSKIQNKLFCYAKAFTKNNFFDKAFFSKERFVFVIGILILFEILVLRLGIFW
jgi:hypothetical protein